MRGVLVLLLSLLFCFSLLYVSGSGSPVTQYSETLSKYLLLVSSAVYHDDTGSKCISNWAPTRSLRISHHFKAQYRGIDIFGWAGVDDSKQRIVFSYKGSYQFKQLLQELTSFMPRPISTRFPDIKVNPYFRGAQQLLWRQTRIAFLQLQLQYPKYQIIFTGHSLGGAIASIALFDLFSGGSIKTPSNVIAYTFGQPRTGNIQFARYMDKNIPTVYRVVHNRDIVAHLPPCFTQLLTRGCSSDPRQYAYHHGIEIWYKEDMPNVLAASSFAALEAEQFDDAIMELDEAWPEEDEFDSFSEEEYDESNYDDAEWDSFDSPSSYTLRPDADSPTNQDFDSGTETLAQKAVKTMKKGDKSMTIADIAASIDLDQLENQVADGQDEFAPLDPYFNDQQLLRGHTISAERPQDNDLLSTLQAARSQLALSNSHNNFDHSSSVHNRAARAEINSFELDTAIGKNIEQCNDPESLNCSDGLIFKTNVNDHRYYFKIQVHKFCGGG